MFPWREKYFKLRMERQNLFFYVFKLYLINLIIINVMKSNFNNISAARDFVFFGGSRGIEISTLSAGVKITPKIIVHNSFCIARIGVLFDSNDRWSAKH